MLYLSFLGCSLLQASDHEEKQDPYKNLGIQRVESYNDSNPGSRLSSFHKPNDASDEQDDSRLPRTEHITDADRAKLNNHEKKSS